MRYFYLPTQDANIYEQYPWKNTGLDEILEVGKSLTTNTRIRSLLQFDIASVSSSMSNGTIPLNSEFDLRLFCARADNLKNSQLLEVHVVSQSWVEGSGYFYQNVNVPYVTTSTPSSGFVETDGTTWKTRETGSNWFVTGSPIVGPSTSASLEFKDISINVTPLVRSLVSGTYENNGLLLKFPDSDEFDNKNVGSIKFFSRNSHTVHLPTLIAKWDDQRYITGSMSASSVDVVVTPRTLKSKYKIGELARVELSVREQYPRKTFNTVYTAFAGDQRLPVTSYYSIVDQQSNTVIIPFDDCSKISCDGTTSYIRFKIDAMYAGRYYKLLIKVIGSDYVNVIDTGHVFKVEN